MFDKLTDYFEGAATKYLSEVDANPNPNLHQHEIGGLPSAGFKKYLGTPGKDEEFRFPATQVYIDDTQEDPIVINDSMTWYDCRRKSPHRSAEYRLYYKSSIVSERMNPGDFLLIAKKADGSLLLVFTPPDTSAERQLRTLFGIKAVSEKMKAAAIEDQSLILPIRMLLQDLGVETDFHREDDDDLVELLHREYKGSFPATKQFSKNARKLLGDRDAKNNPDQTLIDWMEFEEHLFRLYERSLVQERIREGFGEGGDDVDAFLKYSLSVQNRRKSRVGHAFENHLQEVFEQSGLKYARGGKTERKSRPDFLFPGNKEYASASTSEELKALRMLGAKTTCKDRWRQVLAEADKISNKHLITLQPAISEDQTSEMQAQNLQLVVPESIHGTYSGNQQAWLFSLQQFIDEVHSTQR